MRKLARKQSRGHPDNFNKNGTREDIFNQLTRKQAPQNSGRMIFDPPRRAEGVFSARAGMRMRSGHG